MMTLTEEQARALPCIDHGRQGNAAGRTKVHCGSLGSVWLHRLICVFTHNVPLFTSERWEARHICDNPRCIRVEHIIPGTTADNARDRLERGLHAIGERSGKAVLFDEDIKLIRGLRDRGVQLKNIAPQFNITMAQVSRIGRRETWTHVPEIDA